VTLALDDIWPGEAMLLREELLAAPSVEKMFAILERSLLTRLSEAATLAPPLPSLRVALAEGIQACALPTSPIA